MIPLGSCTMKLNAAAEMEPISWPEFANIHPLVPEDQAEGWHELIKDLSEWLVAITGYDAISLQPNSGATGEYAGLRAIRSYHEANGDHERDRPDSAVCSRHQRGICCSGWSEGCRCGNCG